MTSPLADFWPDGAGGAVSLTFDDGHPSQLRHAVRLLGERGLRGSFYLVPKGDDFARRLAPWEPVFAAGHEIGNHRLSHVCSENFSGELHPHGLESTTLEEVEADLVEAERRLQSLFPVEEGRSFAYPCYQTDVGRGLSRKSYVPVVAKHFVAGRASGEYEFFNNPLHVDLHCLLSAPAEHMRAPELIGLVELAVSRHHWICLAFHAIDGGRLGVALSEFTLLLDHLATCRERIWTAPVRDVARHVRARRQELGLRQ